ncbi:type VI lipase adapter Tla3 domain-containing protein [Burkholderia multivorans]|uniref:type VI lipase adapter Tla3 domain-containing protein n=1 Tax=Burkholderia multivorans TaxID=87883 RepID=UPI002018FE34|nr:DUF2875 family protein [Burkholderia multivorans]MCL4626171.1 DUF2875 family protein [Burkholderia multivorans]MCO1386728.1 DUF2875 family protein [Burkholderia multivorans]MDN7398574.1 DUF2875 family protein [Burkholderia multivorans]MDN7402987.1 DUF2875 family protein [Burkholderia multivorans]MDN7415257.1 DUF2875 family protein [Burkholderia multivorans]
MITNATRPSARQLLLFALPILTLFWIVGLKLLAMAGHSPFGDTSMIRRLLLMILPPLLLLGGIYAGYSLWARKSTNTQREFDAAAIQSAIASDEVTATSAQDPRFTLEIRRFGVTVDRFRQRALLMRLDEAGENGKLLLQDSKEYGYTDDDRSTAAQQRENNVFGYTLRGWVDAWPIPVIVAGPPRDAKDKYADRMAKHIGSANNGSGIGSPLFIQLDEIHTEHGEDVVAKIFDFFDRHPDLPAAVVLVEDGLYTRAYLRTPGENYVAQTNVSGYFVPKRPDSFVALLVTRKDRVDRMIRPYVVEAPEKIDSSMTHVDVIKLWNYFWAQQEIYWKEGKDTLPWDYWQSKLPEFWRTTPLKVPAGFKPNPWVPVPWTTWQLRQYDDSPVLAYLHRPIQVNLSNDHGEPLKKGERIEKIRAGWQQAVATLPTGVQPSRMFYDTGSSNNQLALLVQSLHDNPQHIDLDDPKDVFDMQRRIGGDTGTSSTWVQLSLALMMGYGDGKTSALMNLRDPLHASIVMLSPPDVTSRQAHPQTFSWGF